MQKIVFFPCFEFFIVQVLFCSEVEYLNSTKKEVKTTESSITLIISYELTETYISNRKQRNNQYINENEDKMKHFTK